MLGSCIKHELWVRRRQFMIPLTFAVITLIGGVLLRLGRVFTDRTYVMIILILGLFYVCTLLPMIFFPTVANGIHFFRYCCSDRAVLTWTRPVKRTTQFLSTVLSGMIVRVVTLLSLYLSIWVGLLIAESLLDFEGFLLITRWADYFGGWGIVWGLFYRFALLVALSVFDEVLYALITLCYANGRRRVWFAIAVGILSSLIMGFAVSITRMDTVSLLFVERCVRLLGHVGICALLLGIAVVLAGIGVGCHALTVRHLNKKLNLA